MKKGAVFVFYHPDDKCIKNVYRYCDLFDSILVYDNTPKAGGKLFDNEKIVYCANGINDGMSKALDYSFRWAIDNKLDYLLTMDQDSEFLEADINKMFNFIENCTDKNIAVFCPNYRKILVDKLSDKEVYLNTKYSKNQIKQLKWCMTSGSIMKVKYLNQIIPLEDLFIGLVDNYIGYEFFIKGYNICMFGDAVLSQRVGTPLNDSFINRILHKVILSEKRYFYMGRNSRYLIKKYKKIGQKEIVKSIRKVQLRLVFNLLLCEYDKKRKVEAWKAGLKINCPPFDNIG